MTDYLCLVNRQNPVAENEKTINETLMPLTDLTGGHNIYLERTAGTKLLELLNACGANKDIIPVSGYRTKKEQEEIYNSSVIENGLEFTSKYVAYPDTSEHQTGLAIDLALNKPNVDFLCPEFPDYGICEEFRNLAPDYGYILRYPLGKEDITGIAHEPWHFRYVGVPHAREITSRGLCLEEYHEII